SGIYDGARFRRGDHATSAGLLEDVLAHDVVHVSASVVASREYPALSRLVMADEPGYKHSGFVFAREMRQGSPTARLVALEAQPPSGIVREGTGALGFARALLAAGVPTVVGSVVDDSGTDLDRTWLDFHRHYAAGTAAVASLRRAQLAALDESRRTGPWAALTAFGSIQ
ncbi:MAG: CHAT domain-containing protein, partial [Acidobacteria bacterium]|nr:CHAT domain-containing protein [Acidobacteriota bacterium]